jgi:PhnB protein
MSVTVKPIPEGFHTATPYLVVHDAAKAIDFYKRAFGAREKVRMDGPQGKIGHAELQIGDSIIMLADEIPQTDGKSPKTLGGTTSGVFLYVQDVDAEINRASAAGAKVTMPAADMFWGDRFGRLTDPFGHSWSLATHKEEVAPEEMKKRMQAEMTRRQQEQKTKTAG